MLLVHGLGSFARMWVPVREPLERRFDVVAVDLPGFGDTPPLPSGDTPSPVRLADHVAAFLDELGWERAHLVGNSLGGWIALELARRGRATTTCALSPAGFWSPAERAYTIQTLRASHLYARAMVAAGGARALVATGARRRLAFWQLTHHAERMPAAEAEAAVRNLAASRGFMATSSAMNRTHIKGLADVPAATTTIAWGAHDRLLVRPQPDRARAALPGARHIDLPECGHVPTWDDPDVVTAAILSSV
jgi:pimeloyl-ACP methyl ester carboxylesterase